AAQVTQTAPRPIYIAFDEWNVWYRTRGRTEFEIGRKGLEERYNFEDALATGMFLNAFFRRADIVKLANLAQLVNVIAPIVTNKDGMFLQTIYWPLLEYGKQRGNLSLDVLTKSPTYQYNGRTAGYLDVSATYDPKTRQVFVNALNRSAESDIAARIDNVEGQLAASVGVWEMNNS